MARLRSGHVSSWYSPPSYRLTVPGPANGDRQYWEWLSKSRPWKSNAEVDDYISAMNDTPRGIITAQFFGSDDRAEKPVKINWRVEVRALRHLLQKVLAAELDARWLAETRAALARASAA